MSDAFLRDIFNAGLGLCAGLLVAVLILAS